MAYNDRYWYSSLLGLGAGATPSGTADAWGAAEYRTATGAVQLIGTANATWYITGVQLEVGEQPQRLSIGRLKMSCVDVRGITTNLALLRLTISSEWHCVLPPLQ